jgi:spore coat polysaccharide biosynthesis protein SpsF (cytidylyltransferase family)
MSGNAKVLIAIQARLTSKRLPQKVRMPIGGVPILERVINAAKKSQHFINCSPKNRTNVEVCLVVPKGDELAEEYKNHCPVIEGPEDDVLTRYHMALTTFAPDYVVRITADCPLLPPFVITGHIVRAVNNHYDYVSNVDPRVRTAPDGHDCEVVSNRLLKWLNQHAVEAYDREHVTTLVRSDPPPWAETANVLSNIDTSHLKLSVDTEEDLLFVRTYHEILKNKKKAAAEIGKGIFII